MMEMIIGISAAIVPYIILYVVGWWVHRPRKPTCPRCPYAGVVVHFCPKCGHPLACQYDVEQWMNGQARIVKARERLAEATT